MHLYHIHVRIGYLPVYLTITVCNMRICPNCCSINHVHIIQIGSWSYSRTGAAQSSGPTKSCVSNLYSIDVQFDSMTYCMPGMNCPNLCPGDRRPAFARHHHAFPAIAWADEKVCYLLLRSHLIYSSSEPNHRPMKAGLRLGVTI
jgi:hypothetical protein